MHSSIARVFVEARRSNDVVPEYPGVMPATLEEAYEIQDAAITLAGRPVGGWKVGRIPDHLVAALGANRLGGPIFADQIVRLNGTSSRMPVLTGYAAAEAELMLQVGQTPPPDVSLADVLDYVSEVRMGIEIASSPFPGINDHGPAVTVSDFGNNFGLLLGPRIDDWRDRDLLNARVVTAIDGITVGDATAAKMLDGPFGAFRFLAQLLPTRGIQLQPGQWVSSGAITGVHKIAAGQSAEASLDGAFRVSCVTVSSDDQGRGDEGAALQNTQPRPRRRRAPAIIAGRSLRCSSSQRR